MYEWADAQNTTNIYIYVNMYEYLYIYIYIYMFMYASFSFSLHTYVQPGSVRPSAQESLNHPSLIDPKV